MKGLTRRDFLKVSAIGAAGLGALLAAGCGKKDDNTGNTGSTGNAGGNGASGSAPQTGTAVTVDEGGASKI